MAWIFEESDFELLYAKWIRLGWKAMGEPFTEELDIENLIMETTRAGRYDSRLYKWLLTWFIDYQDLINKRRLLRIVDDADSAVLGVIIDIALEHGADHNFKLIAEKCKKCSPTQLLFKNMEGNFIFEQQEKERTLPIYKKWGFCCSMMEFYDDAKTKREFVLKANPQLALRALFGPTLRAEILHCLMGQTSIAIHKLSRIIGYAYSGVYKEVECMVKNGILEHPGKLELTQRTRRMIRAFQA